MTHSLRIREKYRLIAIALLRLFQLLRGEPLFRDVAKDEDRPAYDAGFVANRRADIFDREAAPVLAKEDLVLYLTRPAVAQRLADLALFDRIFRSVRSMMMRGRMRRTADHLAICPAEHGNRGGILESYPSRAVDSMDAFTNRVQQELVLML